ncbi:hypothetical protein [Calothrix sp. UHCC 0171]|uniref:hypothetical protein n=1 Tax=Calothrix sp. UHCC 0171 TaxID=3110245 RepID=UPI002B20E8FC|nr:hypothetical protein [Calothrix sp. UHCC 0171]MEA5574573.1 hypothetical protein [Calothrix sp. UHCC 0171]
MENTQIVLNALIVALMFAFLLLILFDFCAGLINLWNSQNQHLISSSCKPQIEDNPKLSNFKPLVKQLNPTKYEDIATNNSNEIDTESLEKLIQNLPQTRIRTAARRLGIADKVDGKYEKLRVLRMHLQSKLKTQPQQVAQVLNKIVEASKTKAIAD